MDWRSSLKSPKRASRRAQTKAPTERILIRTKITRPLGRRERFSPKPHHSLGFFRPCECNHLSILRLSLAAGGCYPRRYMKIFALLFATALAWAQEPATRPAAADDPVVLTIGSEKI